MLPLPTRRPVALILLCALPLVVGGCGGGGGTPTSQQTAKPGQATGQSPTPNTPAGSDSLQGTWEVVGFSQRGRTAPAKNLEGQRFIFTADTLTMIHSGGVKTEYQYTVDAASDPKGIDVTPVYGGVKGTPHRGIFRLTNGELTIALNMKVKGSERPKDFQAPDDLPEVAVRTLKRVNP